MRETRILVAEDEAIVAKYLHARLETLGYRVCCVALSASEAIAMAVESRPDLLLMDIGLPGGIDGVQAVCEIHKKLDVPVIYLTAYSDDETLERAKLTEPCGYLLKPINDRELRTTIETALYRHLAQQRRLESRRWLSAAVDSTGDGVLATDAERRVIFMNPAAESMTGWRVEEACGQVLEQVFDLRDEAGRGAEDLAARMARERKTVSLGGGAVLKARDGSEIPVAQSAAPVCGARGDLAGMVVLFRDLAEQVEARRSLQAQSQFAESLLQAVPAIVLVCDTDGRVLRFNHAAERLTGCGDRELKGRDWIEALVPAGDRDRLGQAVRRLVTCPSRSAEEEAPLSGCRCGEVLVRWFLSALRGSRGDAIGLLIVGTNVTELRRTKAPLGEANGPGALVMSAQSLAAARRQPRRPRRVNLNRALADMTDRLAGVAGDETQLCIEPAEGLGDVRADPAALEQAVADLVANARDSAAAGHRLTIETANVELACRPEDPSPAGPKESYVLLAVTGVPRDAEGRARRRPATPVRTLPAGEDRAGIGLKAVHEFVGQVGGALCVYDEPRLGTTFAMYLPRAEPLERAGE